MPTDTRQQLSQYRDVCTAPVLFLQTAGTVTSVKAILLSIACACATPAFAADYVYDLSMPYYAGTVDNTGIIVTNCDQCTLNSHDIVSWSMTQTNKAMGAGFGGSTFTSSAMTKSSAVVQGRGFVATPSGLMFDFNPGSAFADVRFTSGGDSVHYTNSPDAMGVFSGQLEDCSNAVGQCAGSTYNDREKIGSRASVGKVSAPELATTGTVPALTLLLAGLAVVAGRFRGVPAARRTLRAAAH